MEVSSLVIKWLIMAVHGVVVLSDSLSGKVEGTSGSSKRSLSNSTPPLEASKSLENLEGLLEESLVGVGSQGKGRVPHLPWGLPCFSQHMGSPHRTRRHEGVVGVEVPSSKSGRTQSEVIWYHIVSVSYLYHISIKSSTQVLSAC